GRTVSIGKQRRLLFRWQSLCCNCYQCDDKRRYAVIFGVFHTFDVSDDHVGGHGIESASREARVVKSSIHAVQKGSCSSLANHDSPLVTLTNSASVFSLMSARV